jgi:hypothetical protein
MFIQSAEALMSQMTAIVDRHTQIAEDLTESTDHGDVPYLRNVVVGLSIETGMLANVLAGVIETVGALAVAEGAKQLAFGPGVDVPEE